MQNEQKQEREEKPKASILKGGSYTITEAQAQRYPIIFNAKTSQLKALIAEFIGKKEPEKFYYYSTIRTAKHSRTVHDLEVFPFTAADFYKEHGEHVAIKEVRKLAAYFKKNGYEATRAIIKRGALSSTLGIESIEEIRNKVKQYNKPQEKQENGGEA